MKGERGGGGRRGRKKKKKERKKEKKRKGKRERDLYREKNLVRLDAIRFPTPTPINYNFLFNLCETRFIKLVPRSCELLWRGRKEK